MLEDTISYRGIEIQVHSDEDAQSPDQWGNDDAFIVYDHRQFCVERKGFAPLSIFEHSQESKNKLFDGYWFFPVDAYIHSGVALSLANETAFPDRQWDVSTTGYVLVSRTKGWTWTRDKARKVAKSIVDEWNMYLSGDVWGYDVEETGDSCWGFYGDEGKKQMIAEAKSGIDHHINNKRTEQWQQLKTWIKSKVGLLHRRPLNPEYAY